MVGNHCEWVRLPVTFSTLHKLKTRLVRAGAGADEIPYVGQLWNQGESGRAEQPFGDYLK